MAETRGRGGGLGARAPLIPNIYLDFTASSFLSFIYCLEIVKTSELLGSFSGGSRNFETGGRGPSAVVSWEVGIALMPLQIYPVFL